MSDNRHYLSVLAQQEHPNGGWGYIPGKNPHIEPTCLTLLAMTSDTDSWSEHINRGRAWLETCAASDGLYQLPDGREEAVWPSAMALFTNAHFENLEQAEKTARALVTIHGRTDSSKEADEVHDIDLNLRGWPWGEGNFSWVEPTAWACLALSRIGQSEHPRVKEGLALLLDRTFDEGGINYGNRHILGKKMDPEPTPTALTLLALQEQKEEPRVIASVEYLREALREDKDLEHLCWGRIALTLYRDLPEVEATLADLDQRIAQSHKERATLPWVQPSTLRQALTAMASSADDHQPFRLPDQSPAEPIGDGARKPRKRSLKEKFQGFKQRISVSAIEILRQPPTTTSVSIAKASGYQGDLADVIQRQYEAYRESVPLRGKRVVLKPNLVEYHRDKVINTHPNIVAAVIELCQSEGASEVIVAEGPGHWRNVEYLVRESGLADVLKTYKIPFVDINHDEPVKRPNLGQMTGLKDLYLSRTIDSADVVISMPKLKTHHWAVATLSLKNLFGTMPGICYGWPKNELHWRGIDNSIVDIALTRTPDLAIVDGIIGMEGDGPLNGDPVEMGIIIMGNDLLAVDATCCRVMQLDPEKITYMVNGARKKLGLLQEGNIEQIGETIASLARPFETLEHFRPVWKDRPA